ncbi:uncharacterized protein NEMAJ01_0426 [Nematocida major]|uniref:uncharacterized protein n=1 Tax=Nematocida major TaxID=1912982 RepID=UPI002008E541|nr:uncharacterized protein NEMAJ01_0426 [Nematocida major]KAH9385530.1 hypothetical protein NEMAJ01_0426 [Nematocida major]
MNEEDSVLRHCACCKMPPTILLAQSTFCTKCFLDRLERGFFSEIRKALSHTFRSKMRKVLVVIDETLSSQAVQSLTRRSTAAMIAYDYCTFSQDKPDCIHLVSKDSSHSSRVEAAKEYGLEHGYDCVIFSHYSVEVAYEILKMITVGEIVQYTTAFKGTKTMTVCYPFYALSYKSILYFCFHTGLLHAPFGIKADSSKENKAHRVLLRDLLKNSPASILNLIKIQRRVEEM